MSYSRILVGTDFSPDAREAAGVAARLHAAGGVLRVAHALPPPMPMGTGLGIYPAGGALVYPMPIETEPVRERLVEWTRECGIPDAEPVLLEGPPGASLAREAERMHADLIVLGARGHSAIERVLLGTTAASVVSHAHTDVLLVRNHHFAADQAPFGQIVLATDFGESAILAAERARELAERFGAKLHVVHVTDEMLSGEPGDHAHPEHVTQRLREFNEAHLGGLGDEHVVHGVPAKVLRHVAADLRAGLLVVGTHGGSLLERLIVGSVARSIAEDAPCSVLVARRETRRRHEA